jgi:hypothetical protein
MLLDRTSESRSQASFQSGTSKPGSRYSGPGPRSESQIRELPFVGALGFHSPDIEMIDEPVGFNSEPEPLATRPRDIIEIDSDESLDRPPVRSPFSCLLYL